MEVIQGKSSNWEGLWWHPEFNGFSSSTINLAKLKKFKGNVRILVRKNKYFNGGENSKPNYLFQIKDSNSPTFHDLEVNDDDVEMNPSMFVDDNWACDRGIECPVCGYDYAHIIKPISTHENYGFECQGECGHIFNIWVFEHKGKIFFERELV